MLNLAVRIAFVCIAIALLLNFWRLIRGPSLPDRILALAKAHGVPVERDPDLLAALEPMEVGHMIPPELFKAVAVMLAALYRANHQSLYP